MKNAIRSILALCDIVAQISYDANESPDEITELDLAELDTAANCVLDQISTDISNEWYIELHKRLRSLLALPEPE